MKKSILKNEAFWRCILDILIGLILILFPEKVIHVFIYLFAGYIIAHGFIHLYEHFKRPSCESGRFALILGVMMLLLGVFMFLAASTLATILPVVIGFFLMLFGFIRVSVIFMSGERIDAFSIIIGVLIIFGGMLSILFPLSSLSLLMRALGFLEVFVGITEIITLWRAQSKE